MKKIGIVTNYANINYGSALQSYALQTKLKSFGFDCENLRYSYGRRDTAVAVIRGFLGHMKRRLVAPNRRADKFRSFRQKFIRESSHAYRTADELKDANFIYNAFICGSDQIWAPNQYDEWYYLSFADCDKPKIAYAPSIGLPSIPSHLKEPMRALVLRMDHVSIREKQGAEIIKELTSMDVPVVLDPTLLLEKERWATVASKRAVHGAYAFCYLLGDNPVHRELARRYCNEHGLKLVAPYEKGDISLFDEVLTGVGPREFINLISRANVVLTDSFHGAAFSINFEKDFHAFLRFSTGDLLCQNSRIFNLLEMFGLQDRLVEQEVGFIPALTSVNYSAVRNILKSQRVASNKFLKDTLLEIEETCTEY